ncbi:MAG: FAD binding domain-containing protein [Rhodospirillales bacterium]|nr:FAD binding domain-containing protein [Rhodospirillales bacterium]
MVERYVAAKTVEEALEALSGGDATVVAGGTDVMPQSQAGRLKLGSTLVNIRRVAALSGLALTGDEINIGPLTTIADVNEHDLIRQHLPVLADAADKFASPQIRNMGTIGGNVCNASPAGDLLVPLLLLNAEVELRSSNGRRRMKLQDFFAGPGKSHKKPGELLTAILAPLPKAGFTARFEKFGTRPALDISTVSVGIAGVMADGGLQEVRVAFGAVAPTPMRGLATEQALEGKKLDDAAIEAAAQAAMQEVKPISDVRATDWYRRELVHNLVRKVLQDVARG